MSHYLPAVSATSTLALALRETAQAPVLETLQTAVEAVRKAAFVNSLEVFTDPAFALNNGSTLSAQFSLLINLT